MLSILTSVVCDSMIRQTVAFESELAQEKETARMCRVRMKLKEVFYGTDTDNNGVLTATEFNAITSACLFSGTKSRASVV